MTQEERFINGELLRLRREERGWVISDMALRSCMSVKQIRQPKQPQKLARMSIRKPLPHRQCTWHRRCLLHLTSRKLNPKRHSGRSSACFLSLWQSLPICSHKKRKPWKLRLLCKPCQKLKPLPVALNLLPQQHLPRWLTPQPVRLLNLPPCLLQRRRPRHLRLCLPLRPCARRPAPLPPPCLQHPPVAHPDRFRALTQSRC
jgi:hypothetical protein